MIDLEIRPDGGDDLNAGTISPEAWERFNADAVWCSLRDLSTHRRELRVAIAGAFGVVGSDDARFVDAASSAPGWFWAACGLSSVGPPLELEDDVAPLFAALDAWVAGEELGPEAPPALHLQLGRGEDLLRDELLFELESGWVIGRRFEASDPLIMSFSMKDLLLDLSRLLALALVDD